MPFLENASGVNIQGGIKMQEIHGNLYNSRDMTINKNKNSHNTNSNNTSGSHNSSSTSGSHNTLRSSIMTILPIAGYQEDCPSHRPWSTPGPPDSALFNQQQYPQPQSQSIPRHYGSPNNSNNQSQQLTYQGQSVSPNFNNHNQMPPSQQGRSQNPQHDTDFQQQTYHHSQFGQQGHEGSSTGSYGNSSTRPKYSAYGNTPAMTDSYPQQNISNVSNRIPFLYGYSNASTQNHNPSPPNRMSADVIFPEQQQRR
ncbi:hypothetical protein AMATHDRAFT_6685 [Amanita thiersii Skay4041]|uniref:Uncharacterized protein n=1 Tax=Amanita thiersii Skay4041 TaxID=703135 RepID=A0A2A9N9B1_9AGAR|nr:hypothetical protein AMATHDRAFT_6685 [Amanita thiersii Skay4041]